MSFSHLKGLNRGASAAALTTLTLAALLAGASVASADTVWNIRSVHGPTHMAPGGTGQYALIAYNRGTSDSDGSPVTIEDTLPAGVTATGFSTGVSGGEWECPDLSGPTIVCTTNEVIEAPRVGTFEGFSMHRGAAPILYLSVSVEVGASGTAANEVTISGGGAPDTASASDPTIFDPTPAGFGLSSFVADVFSAPFPAADPVRQAGAHPVDARFDLDMNLKATNDPELGFYTEPDGHLRTTVVTLPDGFVGDPEATPKCTDAQLIQSDVGVTTRSTCPPTTQVGTVDLFLQQLSVIIGEDKPNLAKDLPVYNIVPPAGAVADFGFVFQSIPFHLIASLDPADHYRVRTTLTDATQVFPLRAADFTLWGIPADPVHDSLRWHPSLTGIPGTDSYYGTPSGEPRMPFLTLPSQCDTPGSSTASLTSWASSDPVTASTDQVTLSGCEKQSFAASLTAQPTNRQPDSPTGLQVDLSIPQNENAQGLGTPPLKKTVMTLPAGLMVNPSSADGLGACTEAQIGLGTNDPVGCPQSSKLGMVEVQTPLLEGTLGGSVYLASQNANPFKSLIALYLVIEDPERGLLIKVPGEGKLDPATGQLTTVFDQTPQSAVFSHLRLRLKSGPRAPLVTPAACGKHTTGTQLTSWNSSLPVAQSIDSFTIDGDCTPRFTPTLNAGTTNPVSGAFSPLSLELQRTDQDGEFKALASLSLPPGLLGDVGSVSTRCTEAQADAYACPAASHIGTVNVGAGAGPDPIYVPGDVYLMGGFSGGAFRGDPFGLAVVVHAAAGPFDLGYVVVKAGIQVHDDGSITTQTEPFPSILQGIPLQLKDIRVSLDRPHFILNPTNCNQMGIAGTMTSTEGQSAGVSSRFQVGECATLAFKPRFSASTQGNGTFNHNGASFDVKLATGEGPQAAPGAKEANIRKVEVELPKALPARLTTLQKACTEQQFATNPAGCPAASNVGTVVAHTPILAAPLAGPAYLVSHGGAAFPDLVLVLQGEGIVLHVTGHTQIKKGITYSRFETIPDAPISSFELKLPEGPFSTLAANANLCRTTTTKTVRKRVTIKIHGRSVKRTRSVKSTIAAPLSMPTTITAQNGMVLKQATKIAVSGCTKTTRAKVRKGTKKGR